MTTATVAITAAGVYDGMPEQVYHADPVPGGSLSASGAKLLLSPSCPAKYWQARCFPPVPKKELEFGTAAHKHVLGAGPELVVVDAPDWRTKKAQQARDDARFEGKVPLLAHEHAQVEEMAAALRKHPVAGPLLDPQIPGKPEQSLFWIDQETGIWRRARLDWLPDKGARNRLIIADYKTCISADTASARKAVVNYGYHVSAAQYIDGARALGLDDEPDFLFIFQEKTAPYLVHVIGLDEEAISLGRERMALACEIWRDCTEAGAWPGYPDQDITWISLPPWAGRLAEEYSE